MLFEVKSQEYWKISIAILPNMIKFPTVTSELDLLWYWNRYIDIAVGNVTISWEWGRFIGHLSFSKKMLFIENAKNAFPIGGVFVGHLSSLSFCLSQQIRLVDFYKICMEDWYGGQNDIHHGRIWRLSPKSTEMPISFMVRGLLTWAPAGAVIRSLDLESRFNI